jgi:hypothetical protein
LNPVNPETWNPQGPEVFLHLSKSDFLEVDTGMKKVLFTLLALALCSSMAMAEVPDAGKCSVLPADNLNGLVLAPNLPAPIPASINQITVRNSSNNPISNASVVITLGAGNVLCGTTVLTGTTNASGQVTITLGGGGCEHNTPLSGIVKANGVTIRSYSNVKSPDFDGAGGNRTVQLGDLISFSNQFLGTDPSECHDYDNDGNTGLGDLIIFSPTFTNPNSCTS